MGYRANEQGSTRAQTRQHGHRESVCVHVCVLRYSTYTDISQGSETESTSEFSYRFPFMSHTWLQAYQFTHMQHKVFLHIHIYSEKEKIIPHTDMATLILFIDLHQNISI